MPKEVPKYGYNYARTRKETEFDTLYLAVELVRKVDRYVLNEKHVSKKQRYFLGKPAADYARKIRDSISDGNDINAGAKGHPDQRKVEERLNCEAAALRYCNKLQFQLMDIIEECDGATEDNMGFISKDLKNLISMIKRWNKSDIERFGV